VVDNSLVPGRLNRNIHDHDVAPARCRRTCGRVLDVGRGDGLLASEPAERCREVVAIDVAMRDAGSRLRPTERPICRSSKPT
jgi:2-polyprenyl-3-methyl-5-hydroxy-6-metoxy-1,4-benzoquinol methylase